MEQKHFNGFGKSLLLATVLSMTATVQAGEKEELLKLRNTTTNLINLLVKQGVLSEENAAQMIKQAEQDAEAQVQMASTEEVVEPDVVRVPYVPEFVKEQIRQQVRADLRADVVGDVMQEAKNQQWGIPNALPEWTRKIKFYGDMRLRYENNHFASTNLNQQTLTAANTTTINDYLAINDAGGINEAGRNGLENINQDRDRFRARFRLGMDMQISQGLDAGVRLTSGNIRNPLSSNQTLGNNNGEKYEFTLDRAFLRYNDLDSDGYNWLTAQGGRIPNPFVKTDLLWDNDLNFEGFASTFRYNLAGSDSLYDLEDESKTLFLTLGAFPLEEFELSTKDKWLLGGQLGTEWQLTNQDRFSLAVSYYKYLNIEAKPRSTLSGSDPARCSASSSQFDDSDASQPQLLQKGNSMVPICNEEDGITAGRFGLASEFEILNITASYDWAMFAPYHIKLTADYAKNFGFDEEEIRKRIGNGTVWGNAELEDRTDAWQVRAEFGWPTTLMPGRWNVYGGYKYIESDAVLDAFTDSNFQLGSTNAKGWLMGFNYGVFDNAWVSARYFSTDQIDGPDYGVDVLLIDFNTQF